MILTCFSTSFPYHRSRVRAIDERWEEVNVRATNTLENIEEDDLDEKDPGRKRRGSNLVVDKRREAGAFDAYQNTIWLNQSRTNYVTFPLQNEGIDWLASIMRRVFSS